jgi:hypothetical protein
MPTHLAPRTSDYFRRNNRHTHCSPSTRTYSPTHNAPHLKVRGTSWMENESRYNRLNSIAGRYIYKGKFTLLNAERGSFPNSSAIRLPDDHMPFGRRHHKDYTAATAIEVVAKSPWRQWLIRNSEADLQSYVSDQNWDYFVDTAADWKGEKFMNFYRGKSDLLP